LKRCSRLAGSSPGPPHIRIAVNVSAVQFGSGNLFDHVLQALEDSGLSPLRLELEIADTSLLQKEPPVGTTRSTETCNNMHEPSILAVATFVYAHRRGENVD
jgi:EAL domain-containing protein (putative c-di-GMP-specific phosphodiesterase class I)